MREQRCGEYPHAKEIRFFNPFFIRFASCLASIFLFVRNAVKCYFTDIHSYLSVRACDPHEKEGGEGHPRLPAKGFVPGPPDPVPSALPGMSGCQLL
jgi:hypothetical protein